MADVQIAVIDQQNTQIALAAPAETQVTAAVPGVQGPVGEGVPQGGSANQVLFKQSGTDYDTAWGEITSEMIGDLEIVDADVATAAAIAGTKISPNFGSQNVITTGTSTAASFTPTSSTVPTNGVYLPAANSVALSTNGTGRLFVDASGRVGIGASSPSYPLVVASSGSSTLQVLSGSNTDLSRVFFGDSDDLGRGFINYDHSDDSMRIGSNNAERLRITSAGLVGIGTSSVSALFHVAGDSSDGTQARITGATNQNYQLRWGFDTTNLAGRIQSIHVGTAYTPLLLNPDGGVVGIGTTSPSDTSGFGGTLDINGTTGAACYVRTNGSATNYGFIGHYGTDFYVNNNSNGPTRFFTNGAERARIDSSGRVGIGTSAPQGLVTLSKGTGNTAPTTVTAANSFINIGIAEYGAASNGKYMVSYGYSSGATNAPAYIGLEQTSTGSYTCGDLTFYTRSVTTDTAPTERLRITNAGLVGIGTSSPAKSFVISSGGASGMEIGAGNGNAAGGTFIEHYNRSTAQYVQCRTIASDFLYQVSGTDALAINSSGRVGIGTTSPAAQLNVSQSTGSDIVKLNGLNGYDLLISNTQASGTEYNFNIGSGAGAFSFSTSAGERARIDSSGRLLVGTSSDSGGALFQVNGDRIRVATAKTPASATDTGTTGEICWDADYLYVCTATNTWKRAALSTW